MDIDVSPIIEQQKLSRFLIGLIVISWIITFFDGFDTNLISFASPYFASEYHLDRIQVGNIFSIGLVCTLIGEFIFGYAGDRIGRRPAVILATAAFGVLTMGFAFANGYRSLFLLARPVAATKLRDSPGRARSAFSPPHAPAAQ